MRWELTLDVNVLEKTFRSTFYKFVKEIISTNLYLYRRYYEEEKAKVKPFTFLPVLPPKDRRFEGEDRIVPLAPVKLFFSTNSPDVASTFARFVEDRLYTSLFEPVVLDAEGGWLDTPITIKVLKVRGLPDVPGEVEGIKVRFPALVVNHKRYKTIEELFERSGLLFEPVRVPKRYSIKHRIRDTGVVYTVYDLEGRLYPKAREAEVRLRDILSNGFGWRKSQGFGYCMIFKESRKKDVEFRHEQKPVVER